MIELKHVTRFYGRFEALHDLSFTAPDRQIIGLLGQNGAGKTTTLNILTGYMPPTSGEVWIGGKNMLTDSRECKRMLGYLPERPPLYDEMSVRSYLEFVCSLREVAARSIRPHTENILQLCGLAEVADRLVGHLSKGFRQRVGIAQALCGDPEVLVLDEPTVGLDPRQVVEIRELIRHLGETHTVIFSSHLLSEIQQLCSRAIILHHGRLVKEADMNALEDQSDVLRLRASIRMKERELLPALRSLPCVLRMQALPTTNTDITEVSLECAASEDPHAQLFHLLCALDAPIRMLTEEKNSLEEAFLRATAEE